MNLRISAAVIGLICFTSACNQKDQSEISALNAIEAAMAEQERSWSNGDIEGFMSHYEKSADLSFASKNGLTKGYDTLLNRYRKSYPGEEEMGELIFELLEHRNLGNDYMLIVGSWKLLNNQKNPSGYFSLVWKKTSSGWKIIHDHTS